MLVQSPTSQEGGLFLPLPWRWGPGLPLEPPLCPGAHSLDIPLGRGSGYVSVLHHHSWIAALAPEGDLGLWGKGSSRLTSAPILMSQGKGVQAGSVLR